MKIIIFILRRYILSISVISLFCLNCVYLGQAAEIIIVTEEFPPYNYTDPATGDITGFSTEIVRALLKEINVDAKIRSYPWARSYKMAEEIENVMIFSMKRTTKREELFKWVGELIKHKPYFLTVKNKLIKPVDNLEELKKYTIAAIRKGAIVRGLKADGFPNVIAGTDRDANWKILKGGRIDLWCTDILSARHTIKSLGDNYDDLKIIYHYKELSKSSLYMAFSKQTDDTIVEMFRKGFNQLKTNGIHQKILKRYGI